MESCGMSDTRPNLKHNDSVAPAASRKASSQQHCQPAAQASSWPKEAQVQRVAAFATCIACSFGRNFFVDTMIPQLR